MDKLTIAAEDSMGCSEGLKLPKTMAMIQVLRNVGCRPRNILVAGCGTGSEAGTFARAFGVETIGIDIGASFAFDHAGAAPAILMQMDARDLTFADKTFDLVYSFHALEHIPRPADALREMCRVLRPGGHFLLGTPNKSRILGYLNATDPLLEKVIMNFRDFGMRLQGRWTNEAGAHAGFTSPELNSMCRDAFGDSHDVSEEYYSSLYSSKAWLVKKVCRSSVSSVLLPCVYVFGSKQC